MEKKQLYPNRVAFGKSEIDHLNKVIKYYKRKKIDPPYRGYFEKKLSKQFSKFMNGGFTLPVATGTSAAFVAIQSLLLKQNSEILVSPVNDSGPINSIIYLNLKPVLIDSKINSYNVDLESLKKKITKKTKAVLLAHIGGRALEIGKISKYLKKRNILLIEDCSQAAGAGCYQCKKRCKNCYNKKIGEFGEVSFFSTMYRKNIASAGSGGLVFTKNKKIFKNIQSSADRGKQPWKKVDPNDPSKATFPALNHNTNEFTCAITSSSLKRLNKTNFKRREIIKYLIKKMGNCQICKPSYFDKGFSPFFFPIEVNQKKLKISKFKFANELKKLGVGLLEEYNCVITKWKWAKKFFIGNFRTRNAKEYSKRSFNLFINENFTKYQIDQIVKRFMYLENKYNKKI